MEPRHLCATQFRSKSYHCAMVGKKSSITSNGAFSLNLFGRRLQLLEPILEDPQSTLAMARPGSFQNRMMTTRRLTWTMRQLSVQIVLVNRPESLLSYVLKLDVVVIVAEEPCIT